MRVATSPKKDFEAKFPDGDDLVRLTGLFCHLAIPAGSQYVFVATFNLSMKKLWARGGAALVTIAAFLCLDFLCRSFHKRSEG